MLGLLSKPQAAAQLLSSEAHPQASASTAAPTPPHHGNLADCTQAADLQIAPASGDLVTGPAEATINRSWTSGKAEQPVLAEPVYAVSQEAASDAAAKEAGAPQYQHSALQSLPRAGPGSPPVPAQLPASKPELGTDAQTDTQSPAEQPRELSQGPSHFAEGHLHSEDRQPVGAGIHNIEQAPAKLHSDLNNTTGGGAIQQPLPQTAGISGQQGTAAGKQLEPTGTPQAGGSALGKGAKHKGGGKGPKAQKLGSQLTGSAAHALAVLQAGPSSRPVRTEEESGACMPFVRRHLFTQQ